MNTEFCACLGSREGEPNCPCTMINLGLKTKKDYEWSDVEKQKLSDTFASVFEWNFIKHPFP
jgi:hypothetical protein